MKKKIKYKNVDKETHCFSDMKYNITLKKSYTSQFKTLQNLEMF